MDGTLSTTCLLEDTARAHTLRQERFVLTHRQWSVAARKGWKGEPTNDCAHVSPHSIKYESTQHAARFRVLGWNILDFLFLPCSQILALVNAKMLSSFLNKVCNQIVFLKETIFFILVKLSCAWLKVLHISWCWFITCTAYRDKPI
jgi:hypothetical protein